LTLRVLTLLCLAAVFGCSDDNVNAPLKFFPGSQRTSWADCGKFGTGGNVVLVCAGLVNQPGTTTPVSYSISFYLPSPMEVRIAVYDAHGTLVKVLLASSEPATVGQFRQPPVDWDLTDANGRRVPGGDYRVYMRAGDGFFSSSDLAIP
jgi:hypothetical protein